MLDIDEAVAKVSIDKPIEFDDSPTKARTRLGAAALVVVAIASGVGALLVWTSYNSREGVVAAASDLAPGTVLTDSDLVIVEADGFANTFAQPDVLIGQVLQFPVSQSDLIQVSDIGSTQPIAEGMTVIGVLATPGMYPTPDIAPGDKVDVYSTSGTTGNADSTDSTGDYSIASDVRVFNVVKPEFGVASDLLISIEVTPLAAREIAIASATPNGIRFAKRSS